MILALVSAEAWLSTTAHSLPVLQGLQLAAVHIWGISRLAQQIPLATEPAHLHPELHKPHWA